MVIASSGLMLNGLKPLTIVLISSPCRLVQGLEQRPLQRPLHLQQVQDLVLPKRSPLGFRLSLLSKNYPQYSCPDRPPPEIIYNGASLTSGGGGPVLSPLRYVSLCSSLLLPSLSLVPPSPSWRLPRLQMSPSWRLLIV